MHLWRNATRPVRPLRCEHVAVIDVAGYVAELKDHAVDHGFHVHDERHFVETYSLRQVWEVDLHPEEGCGGPLDLHLALEVDPRVLLAFEDVVLELPEDDDPPDDFQFPLIFTWALPPLQGPPDLLRLTIDLAGVGGIELPLEVSAIDSFPSSPTPPSAASPSSPASRCRWPGSWPARRCSATCSTAAWPSAASCSSGPRPGAPSAKASEPPPSPTPKVSRTRPPNRGSCSSEGDLIRARRTRRAGPSCGRRPGGRPRPRPG